MASKVNQSAPISAPISLYSIQSIADYLRNLYNSLVNVLQDYSTTINALVDIQTVPQAPVILKSYVKTALPSAATYIYGIIIVTNDVGGLTIAYSDGANWRRVQDRNVIA